MCTSTYFRYRAPDIFIRWSRQWSSSIVHCRFPCCCCQCLYFNAASPVKWKKWNNTILLLQWLFFFLMAFLLLILSIRDSRNVTIASQVKLLPCRVLKWLPRIFYHECPNSSSYFSCTDTNYIPTAKLLCCILTNTLYTRQTERFPSVIWKIAQKRKLKIMHEEKKSRDGKCLFNHRRWLWFLILLWCRPLFSYLIPHFPYSFRNGNSKIALWYKRNVFGFWYAIEFCLFILVYIVMWNWIECTLFLFQFSPLRHSNWSLMNYLTVVAISFSASVCIGALAGIFPIRFRIIASVAVQMVCLPPEWGKWEQNWIRFILAISIRMKVRWCAAMNRIVWIG